MGAFTPKIAVIASLTASLGAVTFANGRFHLERSKDRFGMRSHGVVEDLGGGRTKLYPLPQSSLEQYIQLRPHDARLNPVRQREYERQEVIGPHQVEGEKLWFGTSYYDGEGMRGVGAFGFFDTATRTYTLYSPLEVAPYEASAILVKPDVVWIGLDRFGEDISTSPGGIVRWNRMNHDTRRYALEFVVDRIQAAGDSLRLSTRYGYAFFHDGEVERFLANGKPIRRFPPPPSHY